MPENNNDNVAIAKRRVVVATPIARPMNTAPESERIVIYSSLHTYWDILIKRRWLIFAVAFALTAMASVYSNVVKPEYRSTARIIVEPDNPEIRTIKDLFDNAATNDDSSFLATQVNVLKSDNLAWQTIEQLHLRQNPAFSPAPSPRIADSLWRGILSQPKAEVAPDSSAIQERLIGRFKSNVIVEQKRDTRMMEVSFDSTDPKLAALAANALVNNYIEYNFRMKYNSSQQTTQWMAQQLDDLKRKVESSQQALVDYERQNSIVNVNEKESVAEQKLADLSRDLTQAQNDRMGKESIFKQAASEKTQDDAVAQNNNVLQKLEEREADLKEQYADARAQYKDGFPKVERLKERIDEIQSMIDRERKRGVERLRNDFDASKAREALLTAAVSEQKTAVGAFNQLLIQHNMLKREFETNQQLYDNLLRRVTRL